MALMNDKIRSVGKAEFLSLTPLDINPDISKCEIAVAYEGGNRNGSYISHEEMEDLGRTLRGIPIVGYYSNEKDDFRDHGHRTYIDSDGIKTEVMTVPYGFIAPDADVWFQDVEEDTPYGSVHRTYLMCTGYLWTGSFPEAKLAVEQGRPQSMELSKDRLNGRWAEIDESGLEFFIIEKGSTLSKLCILGNDVAPCFEGAEITAPEISRNFSLTVGDDVMARFAQMTEELKFALSAEGGLNSVEDEKTVAIEFEDTVEDEVENTLDEGVVEDKGEDTEDGGDGGGMMLGAGFGSGKPVVINPDPDPTPGDDDDPTDPENPPKEDEPGVEEGGQQEADPDADDIDSNVRRIANYTDEEVQGMLAELAELRQFKADTERVEKQRVVAKYSMLSDEDKAEIVENIDNYTIQEIDEKLALVYVRKNVSFEEAQEEVEPEGATTTFSLDFDSNSEYVPQMVSALRRTRQNNKR